MFVQKKWGLSVRASGVSVGFSCRSDVSATIVLSMSLISCGVLKVDSGR